MTKLSLFLDNINNVNRINSSKSILRGAYKSSLSFALEISSGESYKKVTLILLKTYTSIPLIMKLFMLLDRFNDVNKINSLKSIAQVQCDVGTTWTRMKQASGTK